MNRCVMSTPLGWMNIFSDENGLLDIPYGQTISYLELAKKLGTPKAIRSVVKAKGKNPLWRIIPCHRVISDGSLID